jgi:FkbH-like protein
MERSVTGKKTDRKKIKCLVWDLDNTLWKGILAENDQLELRDGVTDIIQELDKRGILLSVASRNNEQDALEKLQQFGLADYFLYPQINWNAKSSSIERISQQLNIGIDTIAFIDDQVFEREEVRYTFPQVRCYTEEIVTAGKLLQLEEFIPQFITSESAGRRLMYIKDEKRNEEEQTIGSNMKFLESLQMKFVIARAGKEDLQRMEELMVRTNQLNATGYTYSYEELLAIMKDDNYRLYVTELIDKYGSYGKIGVGLVSCADEWSIKLLLMSCRVMSRGVGTTFIHFIINEARKYNKKLTAEFFPTDRNRMMYMTYRFAGFNTLDKMEDGGERMLHESPLTFNYPAYIDVEIRE